MRPRVVLAMSGGVDSSVAALLLKQQGYDVIGLFMRTGAYVEDEARRAKTCCAASDARDAQAVADQLDIPFYALDFERDFARIMDRFADDYIGGRTPNPCVLCNSWLKFGKLWAYGRQVGADHVATGHYARMVTDAAGRPRVARGIDLQKDQSYVLFGLEPEVRPRVLFPVGDHQKAEIRALAREHRLPVHDKPESQEICFVPDNDYRSFVRARRPDAATAGPIVADDGSLLGRHEGIEGFTIGQRRGLGIPASGEPRYVVAIEPASSTVVVGPRQALERDGLIATGFHWHVPIGPDAGPIPCLAQIRARHRAVPASARILAPDSVEVRFESPQAAVAPGQVVTLYEGDLVLGGGWIDRAIQEA